MTPVVYVVGLVLIAVGAFCVLSGAPVIRLEQGWTEVIAGSVVGSAGFVMVAIGACLSRLNVLIRTLDGLSIADAQPVDAPAERPPVAVPPPPAEMPSLATTSIETLPTDTRVIDTPEAYAPSVNTSSEAVPVVREQAPPSMEPVVVEPEPVRLKPDVSPEPAVLVETGTPMVRDVEVAAPERAVLPERVIRTPRTRTSFLPSFIGRRVPALTRQPSSASAIPVPAIEPVLTPLREVAPHPAPDRTSVDLSSGWPDMAPGTATDASLEETNGHETRFDEGARQESENSAPSTHPVAGELSPETGSVDHGELHGGSTIEAAPSLDPADGVTPGSPPASQPLEPTVVGRYNAGSASYVMYSNGMIEVETETGTHQFESMQELKRFIEQQDTARV